MDRAELFQGFRDGKEARNELVFIAGFNANHFVFWFWDHFSRVYMIRLQWKHQGRPEVLFA